MNIIAKKILVLILVLIIGILLGKFIFSSNTKSDRNHVVELKKKIWTCSMHPQIRKEIPGQCPICGMDLITLNGESDQSNPDAISMSPEAIRLANIETIIITKSKSESRIELNGKVQADERRVYTQTSHIPGRIENLSVNFTGKSIHTGQTLATLYSPEFATAEQELREAYKIKEQQPALYEAVRARFLNWKFTPTQVNTIEKGESLNHTIEIKADVSGFVLNKKVNTGDYIMVGSPLFEITDLRSVWIILDAYEKDLGYITIGSSVTISTSSEPNKLFKGKVSFIDPVVNVTTRATSVRVELKNSDLQLKPDMFVTGIITNLTSTGLNQIRIPEQAILWTGKRGVVYVKEKNSPTPAYTMREIKLANMIGDYYVVLSGLEEGEEIVSNGTFAIDAAAQLAGKPSMMNSDNANQEELEKSSVISVDHLSANDFDKKFLIMFENYLSLKDALVARDSENVKLFSVRINKSLRDLTPNVALKRNQKEWKSIQLSMQTDLQLMSSCDLTTQRKAFSPLSELLYKTIKLSGISGLNAFYQFCPMAGDKGSYWFSRSQVIRNPYFGDKMLSCGENKETMK